MKSRYGRENVFSCTEDITTREYIGLKRNGLLHLIFEHNTLNKSVLTDPYLTNKKIKL